MPQLCQASLCSGCSACANICPQNAITMEADQEGFLRPVINNEKCIECGRCSRACPILNPPAAATENPEFYAACNTCEERRAGSSSGAIFPLLAQWALQRDGVVFGAAFEDDFSLAHHAFDTETDACKFYGSKYLQSRIGDSYRQVKTLLQKDRYVLFSGTPCQIRGLLSYLGKEYPKLITVDIICHGVPSPAVWQAYVRQRIALDAAGIPEAISFRAKPEGWRNYFMVFQYHNTQYALSQRKDLYMRGFLRNLYLRPSCHQCQAKGMHRPADITIADLWGADRLCPELDDDKGLSLIMVHSKKGKAVWKEISPYTKNRPIGQEALSCNSAAVHSVSAHPNREEFFRHFPDCEDLSALILELTPDPVVKPPSLYRRIRGKLGRMLRSLQIIKQERNI